MMQALSWEEFVDLREFWDSSPAGPIRDDARLKVITWAMLAPHRKKNSPAPKRAELSYPYRFDDEAIAATAMPEGDELKLALAELRELKDG